MLIYRDFVLTACLDKMSSCLMNDCVTNYNNKKKKNFIYHKLIRQIISHRAKIHGGLPESHSHRSRPLIVSTPILTAVSKRENNTNTPKILKNKQSRRVWRSVKVTKHSTIPYVRHSFLLCNSNFVFKTRRFYDIRLQKMLWPWNGGQRSLKVIESYIIR